MNEERMLILKMVSEGKITVEEADSLLQTLDAVDRPTPPPPQEPPAGNWQEYPVDLLKSAAEIIKKQARNIKAEGLKNRDKFLREQKRILRRTLREATRDIDQARNVFQRIEIETEEGPQVRYKDPQQQQRIETTDKVNLEIDHRHGNLEVTSWDENAVLVEYQKIVWAEDKETANAIASEIEIQINRDEIPPSNEETRVSIETLYPAGCELWRGGRRKARVNYWLKVPHQTNLQIDNQHGDISVQNLEGITTIAARHGNVSVHTIDGDLHLDTQHGNIDAGKIDGNVCCKSAHGSVRLSEIEGSVEGNGTHGRQRLHDIHGDLTLNHQHGHIDVDGVEGVIRIDKHHGRIKLKGVRDRFHIDSYHSRTDIEIVSPPSTDCVIKMDHSPVDLMAPANAFESIQASTHHGKISSEFEGELTKQKHEQQFRATPNESGANLQITSHHGRITLRRRAEESAEQSEMREQEALELLDAIGPSRAEQKTNGRREQ